MKKFLLFLLIACMLSSCIGCSSPSRIGRGSWEDQLYYNEYGEFYLRSNSLFERYTDNKIKKNLGYVYSKNGNVLNDAVISSDYCAIVITMEDPGEEYSIKDYVSAFVLNSRQNNTPGTYSIGESYSQSIANKNYTCVPIFYYTSASGGTIGYCEYSYIRKGNDGIFVIIRITATSQVNIEIALKMFESAGDDSNKPSLSAAEE